MILVERNGSFLPSKLAGELGAVGIPVAGVTCTEAGDPAVVVAVQIILDLDPETEKADEAAIDAVCGAHDPAPPPPMPAQPSAADLILGALGQLDTKTATASDVIGAITGALNATDAVAVDPATMAAASGSSATL